MQQEEEEEEEEDKEEEEEEEWLLPFRVFFPLKLFTLKTQFFFLSLSMAIRFGGDLAFQKKGSERIPPKLQLPWIK